jgi:hypothetical protein
MNDEGEKAEVQCVICLFTLLPAFLPFCHFAIYFFQSVLLPFLHFFITPFVILPFCHFAIAETQICPAPTCPE